MILWVGAGLGGLVLLVTSDLDAGAPKVFNGLIATSVVISGACLAKARVGFEWASTEIDRKMSDEHIDPEASLSEDLTKWPKLAEGCWYGGILAAIAAAIIYLVAVWWALPTNQTSTCNRKIVDACNYSVAIPGPVGPRGLWGKQGVAGPRGERGPRGPQGKPGGRGPQSRRGPAGPPRPQGVPGGLPSPGNGS